MNLPENLIEIEPGYSGKAQLLIQSIVDSIYQDQFGDMTLAEVLGALEIVKLNLLTMAKNESKSV